MKRDNGDMIMKASGFMYFIVILASLAVAGGCAKLPQNIDRPFSTAYVDTQDTTIGRDIEKARPVQGNPSGYLLLSNGLDAIVARLLLADQAERSIDAQYYLLHKDVVGALFIDRLYKAAERGVRVRLLVDDIGLEGRDFGAAVLDRHPNIEVRFFNPFGRNVGRTGQYLTGFGKQTRRAHNKSFTVDNQATILGGRNIGDEYFEADPELSFVDIDVLVLGDIAREVSSSFDQYWNSELSYPVSTLVEKMLTSEEATQMKSEFDSFVTQQDGSEYHHHLLHSNLANLLRQGKINYHWADGAVVADDPEKLTHDVSETKYRLSEELKPYLKDIKDELIIFSPYFVPGDPGLVFFKELRDRGVKVKVLTNSLASTDVGIVHAGYARYRSDLLRMGVQLYELDRELDLEKIESKDEKNGIGMSRASLHAKCFILDRKTVFIGSLNLDQRSLSQNTEIGVVFDSEPIARYLAENFDNNIGKAAFRLELVIGNDGIGRLLWHGKKNGNPVIYKHDPYTSFWERFGVGLMGILPIESQI